MLMDKKKENNNIEYLAKLINVYIYKMKNELWLFIK